MQAFQKTAAYHVLVIAGLHVGALVVFLLWLGRRMRSHASVVSVAVLLALLAYVGIVQDRPPILRAALMAALYLLARPLFRRVDLLNTIAIAAMVLLVRETFFTFRFEFSAFVSGRRSYCGAGDSVDGAQQRAVSERTQSFGRRDARFRSRAENRAIPD